MRPERLGEVRARVEARASEADAMKSTAPVGDVLRWVLGELASVGANGNGQGKAGRLLTAKEAAPLLGVTPRWLYRRAAGLPFTRRLGPKTLRFDAEGLARWEGKA